jgi:hypothetical protein
MTESNETEIKTIKAAIYDQMVMIERLQSQIKRHQKNIVDLNVELVKFNGAENKQEVVN